MAEPDAGGGGRGLQVLLVVAQSTGGIGRHVKALALRLPEHGVAVSLCAPTETVEALGLDRMGLVVRPAPLGASSPAALVRTRRTLQRAAIGVDIVHAHGLRAGAHSAASVPATPLVVTWHNAALGGRLWRLGHGALTRYVAHAGDVTLAASDDLAADARAAGARDVHSVFVATETAPPATRSAEQVRAELGIGARPLVVAVGRLQRQKRLDVLVAAASGWGEDQGSPVVAIVGDGPERKALEDQIAATRAPVRLLGSRGDVADLLAAADVMALPSEWEARALVAQEALQAGVALITTAVGGLPTLVGDAAVFVPVGDPVALRQALDAVLADDGRRARMVARGLARAHEWPDQAERIDDLVATYLDLDRRMRLRSP